MFLMKVKKSSKIKVNTSRGFVTTSFDVLGKQSKCYSHIVYASQMSLSNVIWGILCAIQQVFL